MENTITTEMHRENVARAAFQDMLKARSPKRAEKKLNLSAAVRIVSTMREEMAQKREERGKDYLAALDYILYHLTHPDDRTITNELLFYTGGICAALGLCCGICGAVYVFMAKLPEAQTLAPYAGGFGLAALLCFRGVKR